MATEDLVFVPELEDGDDGVLYLPVWGGKRR
jgi:hypothetical protein